MSDFSDSIKVEKIRKIKNYLRRFISLWVKPTLTRDEIRRETENQISATLGRKMRSYKKNEFKPILLAEENKRKTLEVSLQEHIKLSSFNNPLVKTHLSPEVREMVKLRRFSSAWEMLSGYSFWELSTESKMVYILCGQSFNKGAITDVLFSKFLLNFDFSDNVQYLGTIGDRLLASGINKNVKQNYIEKSLSILKESKHPKAEAIYLHLMWCDFRFKRECLQDFDILEYFDCNNLELKVFGYQARYIPFLDVAGYQHIVHKYILDMFKKHGVINAKMCSLILTYIPSLILSDESVFSEFSVKYENDLSILVTLKNLASSSVQCELLLKSMLDNLITTYHEKSLVRKDAILRTLLKADFLEVARDISEQSKDHVLLLPYLTCSGFEYLAADDYRAAKDCFLSVLTEDPADTLASSGLRFAIPRSGSSFSFFNQLRQTLGYGIASQGRTGISPVGSENTISLLMQGKYVEGLYSKSYSYHWRLMKSKYPSKFLNFEEFPPESFCKDKTLFLIGDEGVGDEVRTAQFYEFLGNTFREVVITCDPRLFATFSHSFSNIHFMPVRRLRKEVAEYVKGEPERLTGFDQKIYSLLTRECQIYLDKCDYISFGQNLFYNYFLNRIPRLNSGIGYLKAPKRIKENGVMKVGLLWRSHYRSRMRDFMYMELEELLPILDVENVQFISLQHSIDDDEIQLCKKFGIELIEDIDLFNDFDSMIERFSQLDLVVGISSLPIELSAAIGVPVWMLGITPENFFLRTSGGKESVDTYTLNSTVISARSCDFSEPRQVAVQKTVVEARSQLISFANSKLNKAEGVSL